LYEEKERAENHRMLEVSFLRIVDARPYKPEWLLRFGIAKP
jgi:hypothetical protein